MACSFVRTRFAGASLAACKLTGSTFSDTPLRSATVVGGGDWSAVALVALMCASYFTDVELTGANVTGARLDRCVFAGANLTGLRWESPRCATPTCAAR